MIDYPLLQHHPLSEQIVGAVADKVGTEHKEFIRVHTSYYLAVLASMMRTNIQIPGNKPEPVNLFAINLAPSGFGKGHSTNILENQVINLFQDTFLHQTMPLAAETNIPKIGHRRAVSKGAQSPDDEIKRTHEEYIRQGPMVFSFDSATPPAVKQLRTKLLLANAGSMNLQTDEIGSNLTANMDVLMLFLELFGGEVKNKLVKNTTESIRSEDIKGTTPTSMMLFGVGNGIFDGGKIEELFMHILQIGYARRCFFGFVPDEEDQTSVLLTPAERLAKATMGNSDNVLKTIATELNKLSNFLNMHKVITFPEDTALLHFEYLNDCTVRSRSLDVHKTLERTEMKTRYYKASKLAGIYAFIDSKPEVSVAHYEAAIKVTEESGKAFLRMLQRDKSHVKLAKFLSSVKDEVTASDLLEKVPSFKGTKQQKEEIMGLATEWGYANNCLIKKRYGLNGIVFYRGEDLESTNMNEMIVSFSKDIVSGYHSVCAPWNQLHKLSQSVDSHWINHHLVDGKDRAGYRKDENCLPGFNTIVIDVDSGISLPMAKKMLEGYKALYYTTKSHTDTKHRFRIVMPTTFMLKLDKGDFKEFMKNVFEWLPFDSDTQTGQRSRKWMTNKGHYEYTDGQQLDVLPFIPATELNEHRKNQHKELQSLGAIERWVMMNTGDGNRNNNLLRYAYILKEGGWSLPDIHQKVLDMNQKLPDALHESEINNSIMNTIGRSMAAAAV